MYVGPNEKHPFYSGLHTFFTGEEQGFDLALENLWFVGNPIIQDITSNWHSWENGVIPPQNTSYDILNRIHIL